MKKHINLIFVAAAFTAVFASCNKSEVSGTNLSFVEDIPTIQAFTQEAVPLSDLEKIVKAGINTQSAMNGQPWHFSVVTNKELLDKISKDMASGMKRMPATDGDKLPPPPPPSAGAKAGMGDSPVAIIISAKDGSEFDAGLATQLMTIEAISLGYGTKIISSPTIALNGENQTEYKKALEIPETMNAKAVILIGKYDKSKADAVTGATPRKAKDEVVSFITNNLLAEENTKSESQEETVQPVKEKDSNSKSTFILNSPIKADYYISRTYGYYNNLFTKELELHEGIDFVVKGGTPVYPAYDGTVTISAFDNGLGNYIIISHPNGFKTCYCHLREVFVKKGETVSTKNKIASVGNTGKSTEPHLGFRLYDSNGNTINPTKYFKELPKPTISPEKNR